VRLPGLCRCQWQLGRLAQHVALLVGEHAFETLRFQHAFALVWRHGSQITDGRFHHLPARRWQLLPLRSQLAGLLFLLRRQVLPGFNPVQTPLLFLRGQAVEAL